MCCKYLTANCGCLPPKGFHVSILIDAFIQRELIKKWIKHTILKACTPSHTICIYLIDECKAVYLVMFDSRLI